MSFSSIPNELLILVAKNLHRPRDLHSLIRCNRLMRFLVTPLLHELACEDKDKMSALQWAASRGHEPLVRLLLDKGHDINFESDTDHRKSESALALAVKCQNVAIAILLLDNGANPNCTLTPLGHTALLHAVLVEDEEMVRYLVQKGADVTPHYGNGQTALHKAVERGNKIIAGLLLGNGTTIDIKDGLRGMTPLHTAVTHTRRYQMEDYYLDMTLSNSSEVELARRAEIVKFLLDKGARIDIRDSYRRTALHYAAIEGLVAVARRLLEGGSDPSITDRLGRTVLHYAVINRHETVTRLILEIGGCDIGILDTTGRTPVDWAVEIDPSKIRKNGADSATLVRLLLNGRVPIYLYKWPDGGEVLCWAKAHQLKDIIMMFVENGIKD